MAKLLNYSFPSAFKRNLQNYLLLEKKEKTKKSKQTKKQPPKQNKQKMFSLHPAAGTKHIPGINSLSNLMRPLISSMCCGYPALARLKITCINILSIRYPSVFSTCSSVCKTKINVTWINSKVTRNRILF